MIDRLIAIGYKDLWDDYDIVNPLSLLKDIPTIGILDFIVERQNEVLFALANIELHKKRLFEMRCYLDINAIERLDSLISKHPAVYIIIFMGIYLKNFSSHCILFHKELSLIILSNLRCLHNTIII